MSSTKAMQRVPQMEIKCDKSVQNTVSTICKIVLHFRETAQAHHLTVESLLSHSRHVARQLATMPIISVPKAILFNDLGVDKDYSKYYCLIVIITLSRAGIESPFCIFRLCL